MNRVLLAGALSLVVCITAACAAATATPTALPTSTPTRNPPDNDAPIAITTADDVTDGSITDGTVSLRDAVALASPGSTITVGRVGIIVFGDVQLVPAYVALSPALGPLIINKDLTIQGINGATVFGQDQVELFIVKSGNVRLDTVVLSHGRATGGNGNGPNLCGYGGTGGGGLGAGGAMFIQGGSVTLRNVIVDSNTALGGNGGPYDCFSSNFATNGAGGDVNGGYGSLGSPAFGWGGQGAPDGTGGIGGSSGGFGAGAGGWRAAGPYGGIPTPGWMGSAGAGLGGGIFVFAGSLTVTGGSFKNNSAVPGMNYHWLTSDAGAGVDLVAGPAQGKGSAVFAMDGASVIITGTTFSGNNENGVATDGSASVWGERGSSVTISP